MAGRALMRLRADARHDAIAPQLSGRTNDAAITYIVLYKVTLEVWHPTLQITVLLVNRPRRRACCAIDSSWRTGRSDYIAGKKKVCCFYLEPTFPK